MRRLNTPVVRGSEHPGDAVSEAQECGDRQRPARLTKAAREKPLSGLAPEVFPSAVAQLCVMIRRSVRAPGSVVPRRSDVENVRGCRTGSEWRSAADCEDLEFGAHLARWHLILLEIIPD